MMLQEIEQEALGLSETERARLVLSLIGTLGSPEVDVSDAEVLKRDTDLGSGLVQPISHEDFVRQVRKERGR